MYKLRPRDIWRLLIYTNIINFAVLLATADNNKQSLLPAYRLLSEEEILQNGNGNIKMDSNGITILNKESEHGLGYGAWSKIYIANTKEHEINFVFPSDDKCDNKELLISYNKIGLIKINWSVIKRNRDENVALTISSEQDSATYEDQLISDADHRLYRVVIFRGVMTLYRVYPDRLGHMGDQLLSINVPEVKNNPIEVKGLQSQANLDWYLLEISSRLANNTDYSNMREKRNSNSACSDFQLKFAEPSYPVSPIAATVTNHSSISPSLEAITVPLPSTSNTISTKSSKNEAEKMSTQMIIVIATVSAFIFIVILVSGIVLVLCCCGLLCFADPDQDKSEEEKGKSTKNSSNMPDDEDIWGPSQSITTQSYDYDSFPE